MDLDMAVAAAERTEAARHLIDRAQADVVDLVVVSAIHLCVLGGPRHPLFDESVSRAWMKLGNRQRKKFIEYATESMVERGLLIDSDSRTDFHQHSGTYSLQPELGLMLAARCRPTFIIATETTVRNIRTPRFFALGDQAEPATVLAKLVISPPRVSSEVVPGAYVVSAFRHYDGQNSPGYRLSVQGDGTKARLDGPGPGDQAGAEYDVEGLRTVMADLIPRLSR